MQPGTAAEGLRAPLLWTSFHLLAAWLQVNDKHTRCTGLPQKKPELKADKLPSSILRWSFKLTFKAQFLRRQCRRAFLFCINCSEVAKAGAGIMPSYATLQQKPLQESLRDSRRLQLLSHPPLINYQKLLIEKFEWVSFCYVPFLL